MWNVAQVRLAHVTINMNFSTQWVWFWSYPQHKVHCALSAMLGNSKLLQSGSGGPCFFPHPHWSAHPCHNNLRRISLLPRGREVCSTSFFLTSLCPGPRFESWVCLGVWLEASKLRAGLRFGSQFPPQYYERPYPAQLCQQTPVILYMLSKIKPESLKSANNQVNKEIWLIIRKYVKVVCPKARNTKNPARATLAQRLPQPRTVNTSARPLARDRQFKMEVVPLWLLVLELLF